MTRDRVQEEAFQAALEGRSTPDGQADSRMLALAAAIGRARPEAGPAPDFQSVLRRRIIVEAERAARLPWRERVAASFAARNEALRRSFRVVTATGLAAMLLIGSGAVLAMAANAKPGDWNYGIKRAQEGARMAVTRGAVPRGYLKLEFARKRLGEVKALSAAHVTDDGLYIDTLNDMDSDTLSATELLVKASRLGAGMAPLEALERFAIAQRLQLESIVDSLPPGARPAARDSLTVLVRLSDRVVAIVAGCNCPANPLEVPQGAVNVPPGTVLHGGQSVPCSCRSTNNGGGSAFNSNNSNNPQKPKPAPEPVTPPGADVLPGTVDDPINKALNDLLDTLGLPTPSILQTPLPVPLPSTVPSLSLKKTAPILTKTSPSLKKAL